METDTSTALFNAKVALAEARAAYEAYGFTHNVILETEAQARAALAAATKAANDGWDERHRLGRDEVRARCEVERLERKVKREAAAARKAGAR